MSELTEWRLVVPGEPVPQPRQRHGTTATGRSVNYTPADHPVQGFKVSVQWIARAQGVRVLDGAVGLQVTFYMKRPKGRPVERWHTVKPDTDNLIKGLKDALTGIAWHDDGQVAKEEICKEYVPEGMEPQTVIYIYRLEQRRTPG